MASPAPPAPPVLPISRSQPTTVTVASTPAQHPSGATPAIRSVINNITDYVRYGFSQRRPWLELVDRSAISKPESFSEAALRVRKNYTYFKVNYLSGVALILGVSLLTHPFSLILLAGLLAAWLFLYVFRQSDQPLIVFGRTFSNRETLGILIISSIVVLFLTNVGYVLVSGLIIGFGLICAHGAFRQHDDLFMDEHEQPSSGFMSFLGAPSSNATTNVPLRG